MTKRIFRSVLFASVAALLAGLIIVTGILYSYFTGIQMDRLQTELDLAAAAVSQSKAAYLSTLKADGYRLTWVDADGSVLFDTSADASKMGNHADREEIKEAFETGHGESERYSSTLTEKNLYRATRLPDNTVLRISTTHATVLSLLLGMLQPIIVIFILLVVLAAVLAARMAKRIVEPLNEIDLDNPLENDAYEELTPLLRRVNRLHGQVGEQMRELKRKTDEFKQIIGSMNEGLVLLDEDGSILSINNAAIKIFDTDSQCIGRSFLSVERSVETQTAINTALSDGHSEIRTERNGCEYQFDISRIDSDDKAIGVVLLAFDVTDKVFAERNRREFTANVSHELKTPLQAIMGSAELIENGIVKPEDLPRFVGHIRTDAARLVALIDDIIQLSQLDEGSEPTTEDIDLYKVAEETVSELEYIAEKADVTLKLTGCHSYMRGVRKLICEICYNLCENAIKYNLSGGSVSIGVAQDEKNAVLTVSDTGIGIPIEHQSRVFERFYRVDKSHSRETGGTGLGLSIVKHAVQYHHGKITLESQSGKGSTFTVTFPSKQ